MLDIMCSQIVVPEFTKEQVSKCEKCRFASRRKIWCCFFGVPIGETSSIKLPRKSIIRKGMALPMKPPRRKSERPVIEQESLKKICGACEHKKIHPKLGLRCGKSCSCCFSLESRWKIGSCPVGKW